MATPFIGDASAGARGIQRRVELIGLRKRAEDRFGRGGDRKSAVADTSKAASKLLRTDETIWPPIHFTAIETPGGVRRRIVFDKPQAARPHEESACLPLTHHGGQEGSRQFCQNSNAGAKSNSGNDFIAALKA